MASEGQRARNRGKSWEREVAKDLGTTRTGPTGYGDPDVKFDPIAIECKSMSRISLRKDHLEQASKNAKGKPWVLLLKEVGTGVKLAVMPYDQWKEYALWLQSKN